MDKLNIKVVAVGHLPPDFRRTNIPRWKSNLFELSGDIESFELTEDSDGPGWEYSDALLEDVVPNGNGQDFLVALTNVPLECNWYTRRLSGNRIVFTFHEIKEVLRHYQIPLENVVLRVLYAYSFVYLRNGNSVPESHEITNFTHDETRGCVFDMNGIKTDISFSCVQPTICDDCKGSARREKVSNDRIENAEKELSRIRKPLFHRMGDFIKAHPVRSLVITSLFAIILGVVSSLIGSYLFHQYIDDAQQGDSVDAETRN
jgi:hypothetical protein